MLQILQCLTQLVRTRGPLHAAADALQLANDFVNLLTPHQRTYPLQITVAASDKEHLLYHIILVCRHVDGLRAYPCGLVNYMFRPHNRHSLLTFCIVEDINIFVANLGIFCD